MSGLVLWLRPDQGVAADGSGGIAAWTNLALTSHAAAQTNAAARPQWRDRVYKGEPAAGFDGTNDWLAVPSCTEIDSGGPYTNKTLALAFRTGDNIAERQVIYEQGGTNAGLCVYIETNTLHLGGVGK